MDNLVNLWASLSAPDIVGFMTATIVVSTFFEGVFGFELIGKRFFRFLWRIARPILNWLTIPIKPGIDSGRRLLGLGDKIDALHLQIQSIAHDAIARDERRSQEFNLLDKKISEVQGEMTANGGGTLKDQVTTLIRHDRSNWEIFRQIWHELRIVNMRLDIQDDADKRMPYELSPTLEYTKISPVFLRMFGYVEKDIIGNDWEIIIAEEDREEVRRKWERAAAKQITYRNEQILVDSDGARYKCLVRGWPIPAVEGETFRGFYGTIEVLEKLS